MKKWKIKESLGRVDLGNYAYHPVIMKLFYQRGLNNEKKISDFLFPDFDRDILDPFLFSQMEKVVERIKLARDKKEKVVVYGDYDADGVTSSVILRETLGELGINSQVYIPDKKTEGYGLNERAILEFKNSGASLVITVDCGISNFDEVEKINSLGMEIIILDHHHVPPSTPNAYAIINPQMSDSGYPEKILSGVGVAFKTVQAIYRRLMPEKESQSKWLLDLVAIGTVADCVPLTGENRVIVRYGMIVLSKTRRVGLQELFKVGRIKIDENNPADTYKISFQITPRINAAGRMDHANIAFNLLCEKDRPKARDLALELEKNNQNRQKTTAQVVDGIRILAENSFRDRKIIFAANEHYPVGIVGLVAGRIADEYGKPTGILNKGEQFSQGSFRSIPQVNIIETIEACSDLLEKYGGHDQAAGLTVANENLEKFFERMNGIIEKKLEGVEVIKEVSVDLEIGIGDLNFELASMLSKLEPFGNSNEEPVFLARNLVIWEVRLVGNGEKHLKLSLCEKDGSPKIFEAIGFGVAGDFPGIKKGDEVDAVFNLRLDEWNGNKRMQLIIIDMQLVKN